MHPHAVLHLALAEVVQTRRPLPVLREIVRHALREQNVPGVAAIHHSLREVNPGAGNVFPLIHIGYFVHRSAMNSHPQLEPGLTAQSSTNLQRAQHRRLRIFSKDQHHPCAARRADAVMGFVAEGGAAEKSVTQVSICGGLPNLRTMTVSLMERLDVEVEALDSLFGIDAERLPGGGNEFRERVAELRLAWAAAAGGRGPGEVEVVVMTVGRHPLFTAAPREGEGGGGGCLFGRAMQTNLPPSRRASRVDLPRKGGGKENP